MIHRPDENNQKLLQGVQGDGFLEKSPPGRPILKWAGGKQQLLQHLLSWVPQNFNRYIEPFVGGGALFFALNPGRAIISDSNPELINVYNMAAHHVEELVKILKTLKVSKDSYYEIRGQETSQLSDIEKAARTIYLNRTWFILILPITVLFQTTIM